jgi:hypothetical protein
MTWLRDEYTYPEGYPDRDAQLRVLPLLRYPPEVNKIRVASWHGGPSAEEIPTDEEMEALVEAAINPRDRAYLAVSKELGPRIGGISFDEFGARVSMSDKTMDGEPVRLVESASYLRQWIEAHPFRDDPEAPLWVDLAKMGKRAVPLTYAAFRGIIARAVERHNRLHPDRRISKRLRTHLFRYYAQTRDERDGVPRSVQCRQRGWKADSRQPDRYARLVSRDVDEYYARRYGLAKKEGEDRKPRRCPRCREVNPPRAAYCLRCGLPLNVKSWEEYRLEENEALRLWEEFLDAHPGFLKLVEKARKR